MALFPKLKPIFKRRLRPFVQRLARAGATPNQVMLVGFMLSASGAGAVLLASFSAYFMLAIPVVLILKTMLNATDGMLTREYKQQSQLGAVLTELGDIFADVILYMPFALIGGIEAWLMILLIVLMTISEVFAMIAHVAGVAKQYDGPMGKSDRAAMFSIIALVIGFGITPGLWTNIILGIMVAGLAVAAGLHLADARQKAKKKFQR
ncbi:MAG TPA: CDP-alcohol phosphatidyltransferase family protein [Alphaproteobacteria bacterium]|nr:CDP-alcohol phosphatidyltransferase family protein [Alphaproteobacteria bacterium]